jgi:hypothetical protein
MGLRRWLLAAAILSAVQGAQAQIPAFPGAEGVAKNITGGRGGDVYKVTNLADSGAGSLRHGIQTAPTTGRTIVFDVAGTINLATSLDFNGKDNVTIAGQTAPGGGITLAGHRLRINSLKNNGTVVDQLNNVIVQHLRVRPTNQNANTDGVWVESGNGVIVDHVTTSWSVDESISVTHDSDNVTVQWSTMTQGLFDHSYGSLLNGGTYTYAYNFYAHNKSRNPRLQESGDSIMELDFVNNVIYNPQDKFAYGGGEYYVNIVGNYGIRGPGTNDTNHALIRDTDTESHFYLDGNLVDNNNDGTINGVVPLLEGGSHDAAIFHDGQSYTLLPSRVNVPQTNVMTANKAYVHVLSRAGAATYRDAHDRDMIYSVINQQPGFISDETEWGPMPTLPTGSPLADANGDGVPDVWASANYGDTSTPLNTTVAPDGYTYLEKYVHSLTPYAYAPTNTVPHTIRTSFGNGADAQVNENGGTSATSSGSGAGSAINVHWDGTSGSTNQAMLLRFDLSEIVPGSVDSARLELTAASNVTGAHEFKVYGLIHDAEGWDWDESTVDFVSAPGLVFNGNSRTLGIDPRYTADGQPAERDNQPLPAPADVLALGALSFGSLAAGQTVSFDNLNLAVLLNLAAYFEGEDQQGLVTLIVEQINSSTAAGFYSKEGSAEFAPRLVVDALLNEVAPPVLAGDYNGDGIVDAVDYTVWRNNLGEGDESNINNAGDGLNGVDPADYDWWKQHYGDTAELGAGGLASSAVPEPANVSLAILALSAFAFRSRSERRP